MGTVVRSSIVSAALVACAIALTCCRVGRPHDAPRSAVPGSATVPHAGSAEPAPSDLFRSSIEVTALRLSTLFPGFDVEREVLGTSPAATSSEKALAGAINGLDRPSGAIAQVVLRKLAGALCARSDAGQNRVFSERDLLMGGESWPADPAERAAFVAARNVFLYPYTADSAEVQALAQSYRSVLQSGGSAVEARQVVCTAAFLAPQFWLGNGGEYDFVRKVALEVGRRLPTFAEYEQVMSGALGKEGFVRRIQSEPGYLTAVRAWHRDWLGFKRVAQLKPPSGNNPGDLYFPRTRYRATDSGALGMAGADITTRHVTLQRASGERSDVVLASHFIHEVQRAPQVEVCDEARPFEQAFDPTTSKIVWEIWNPAVRRWEQLGAQVAVSGWLCEGAAFRVAADRDGTGEPVCKRWKDGAVVARREHGRWMCVGENHARLPAAEEHGAYVCGGRQQAERLRVWMGPSWEYERGRITLAGKRSMEVSPEDITGVSVIDWQDHVFEPTEVPDPEAGLKRTRYRFASWSKLSGTPVEYFANRALRARRFDRGGREQNGYSAIRLYWSGQVVYVCNAFTRPETTCAYRPPPALYGMEVPEQPSANWSARLTEAAAFNTTRPTVWKAGFYLPIMNWAGYGFYAIGKASGWVMDNFSCGIPNLKEYERGPRKPTQPDAEAAREEIAFPKTPPYNDTAFNVWQTRLEANALNEPEVLVQRTLVEDVNAEPYRLLEHIVREGLDYRMLLTAPYTFGSPAYELLLRAQGYFLPAYPPGEYPRPGDPAYDLKAVRKIQSLPSEPSSKVANGEAPHAFETISREWLRNSRGFERNAFAIFDSAKGLYEDAPHDRPFLSAITPRPMSGILTMADFMQPLSPKTRSLAARIFSILLCTDPSGLDLTPEQERVQARYEPKNPAHLDRRRGCYQCHINLDPFGKAMNNRFLLQGLMGPHDDLEPPDGVQGGELHGVWGIHGSSDPAVIGEGAFQGKVLHGVREVARAVADSREFSQCVVTRHFEAVYGRHPSASDVGELRAVADAFQEHHDYDAMIRDLLLRPVAP